MRHRLTGRTSAVWAVGAFLLLLTADELRAEAGAGDPGLYEAGPYSFSDELGGFRITSATGTGTKEDPVVITQELHSASPVTLVIRAIRPIEPFGSPGNVANGFLHLRTDVLNNGGQAWIEFEFELQEILGKASVFGDGLSFDQRQSDTDNISSDSFAEFSRDFEPYDRLLFKNGRVDPLETASFSFLVTDFTPRLQFYLVLDPRIPSS
jgi:hypothetical protein